MADTNGNRVSMTEKQKVKEITDRLEEGLKELFESEKYKNYLTTMSKFHNYSFNNTLLITLQKPDASLVCGYQAWQKNFNRHVKKGEKAIRILAPAPYKIKEERDKLDPVTGEMVFDENGMPQKEEVEVKIPAFRVVSVFDVSQTEGEPLPELEAKELLSTVEGYEDFIKAITYVAPVPIAFEDIPGDSKGYFHTEENRIAVQEGMSESQTLKTLVHETAHSMLHNKEINQDILAPVKDRNTKEIEAEGIAFTVCSHFGIDTSSYSFYYIGGWSSGRDMKELKSSLDTIRRTSSELITGIEEQLKEIWRDREMMSGQEKESLLLIQNSDLSEYSLVNVWGMDAAEIVEALSDMNDDDRLNAAAYLESRGAWVTEIANQDTKEFGEYHLDVCYNTDTNEVIDLNAERERKEKAKEPVGADDVIVKMVYEDGEQFEIARITNKTQEEVKEILQDMLERVDSVWEGDVEKYFSDNQVEYIPVFVRNGKNPVIPEFYDYEVNLETEEIEAASELPIMKQAEQLINRMEFSGTVFDMEEKNLIMNHAYKLDNMEETVSLARAVAGQKNDISLLMETMDKAQAEIDALPGGMIGLSEMHEYGYTWEEMLPLTKETAIELFERDLPVYQLHEDGSETLIEGEEQITEYDGIFGIEKNDWENERAFRSMQEELAGSAPVKEAQLLYGDTDKYGIYQLKDSPELRDFHFAGTEELLKRNLLSDDFKEIQPGNYNLVYTGELSDIQGQTQSEKLGALYVKFNIDHPADYKGHSLSVSDVVVLHEDGKNSTHFVDSYGFTELPHFTRALEGVKEQEADKTEMELTEEEKQFLETDSAPLIAKKFLAWDEIEDLGYRFFEEGYIDKFKPMEKALFGGGLVSDYKIHDIARRMQGGEDVREELAKALIGSYERVTEVGEYDAVAVFGKDAVTVTFGNATKQIFYEEMGTAFLGLFEREYKDIEQARAAEEQEKGIAEDATSGHDVQKPETEQSETEQSEQPETEQSETEQSEQKQPEQNEPEKSAETLEFADMEDEDEIIDLGDDREQVLAELKQSLEDRQDTSGHEVNHSALQNDLKLMSELGKATETELAFQIADRYISIQETEGGYDYSIMGADYKEIDGGVYDNPDVSIQEALNDIVEDLKENPFDNGARGNIQDSDELIPIDYDELMEKVEEANHTTPPIDVVAEFRAKTKELFHEISEMNPSEIEETVKCHVQAKIDESGIAAEIVDVAVAGSRCRGLEREGSDLDVVVELSTNEREDVLFDTFNEGGLHIGGIQVDINPITAQRTGTLETYLPKVEEYLDGVREARENEPVSIFNIRMNDEERWFKNTSGLDAEGLCKAYAECDKPFVEMGKYGECIEAADHAYIEQGNKLDFSIEFNEETDKITIFNGKDFEEKGLRETLFPEQAEPEITLTVAECGEFHNLGEFYKNILTVDEAVAIWKQIPPERMNGIPAIGINIHTPGTEAFEDVEIDILSGKRIDLDILEYIPEIKDSPQAMEVIAELAAKFPEMEIDGNMTEEFEAKVWEKRLPGLIPAEQLAVEFDRFTFDYDTAAYRDNARNMTENVSDLAESISRDNTSHLMVWLADVIAEGTDPEETKRAAELLEKLAEYKPLAKIEEMEEQNYNMVDNVLNNGAGEKTQKEENKKEQERPAVRTSLKARLAEKKALVSGQGKDHEAQENNKNNQREM
mgnify:CR=1 FL=1|jgi:antirestriction protein ArdC/predicted nucleotidyltransferase